MVIWHVDVRYAEDQTWPRDKTLATASLQVWNAFIAPLCKADNHA